MPTYFRAGNVHVRLFNGDHNPPHVHVWSPEGDMMISLVNLEPLKGRLSKQEYELAIRLIRDNIAFLREEWERLNG